MATIKTKRARAARLLPLVLALGAVLTLSACDDLKSLIGKYSGKAKPAPVAQAPVEPAKPANPMAAPMPDVGKVDSEVVQSQGAGATAAEAVDEAIRLALKQVNGQSVDLSSEQLKVTLSLAQGKNAEALRGTAFAEHIVQSAGGAITGFKVNSLEGPDNRGFYRANLQVSVAKFKPAAADSKKLKIVVAPMRHSASSFPMGGASVPADQVAEEMRQAVIAALTATGRFAVLDRDLGGEIDQELDMISSGQAPRAEFGKLGQAISADVVWIGTLDNFAYQRRARKLQTSDRELVSYAGGWSLSQKLVSVATRQVMLSETLRGEAPSTAPTTLGTGVDGAKIAAGMRAQAVERMVSDIVARTFPITVISREGGNVVLSQGGQAVKEKARYRLVALGKEMFDPQTNQSLGRLESECCEVVIDRVTPTMAQGHLEKLQTQLDDLQPGSLQLREMLPAAAPERSASAAPAAGSGAARPARAAAAPKAPREPAAPARDDKW